MLTPQKVTIGPCDLWLGDCREILPTLGTSFAIVTDPPYGIGACAGTGKYGRLKIEAQDQAPAWDNEAPDLGAILMPGAPAIVWGGNYFGLPASRCWLIWDKGAGFKGRAFAECEIAWTNIDANARIFAHDPLAARDYRTKEHPTQKPVPLMEWCLGFIPSGLPVIDPFMGSGTTGVACVNLGRKFIGIEREPKYFEIAVKRISHAVEQSKQRLFTPEPEPQPDQPTLGLDASA